MMKVFSSGHMSMNKLCLGVMALLLFTPSHAQITLDTVKLSLPEAEKMFMEKNLSLLASKYNIDVNKALIEQAKLVDNPVLVTDQNIYAGNKFFAHGKDANGQVEGQYFIQIQQLIKTAGKRSKWVAMAVTNAKLSELQFNEVMRNLKYQLRMDYYTTTKLSGTQQLFINELKVLDKLLSGMAAQLQAGNIAQKDYLRIQALRMSMQQDLLDNNQQLADTQTELKTLLQITDKRIIATDTANDLPINNNLMAGEILSIAKQYNSAYAIEQMQFVYQQQNLRYQQSLRSADITLGPEYDHNSNYTPHYVGLSVSLPLNIFNKNQGNIKSAEFAVKQEAVTLLQVEQQLQNTVQNAVNKFLMILQLRGKQEQSFYTDNAQLFKNITDSYTQRQISLIEFIDFFDAYRDTQLKNLQQQLNLQLAKEELNYLAGKDVVN